MISTNNIILRKIYLVFFFCLFMLQFTSCVSINHKTENVETGSLNESDLIINNGSALLSQMVHDPEERFIVSLAGRTLKWWDIDKMETIRIRDIPSVGNVSKLKLSPSGKFILVDIGSSSTIWDFQSGDMIFSFKNEFESIRSLDFLDDRTVVISPKNKKVIIYDFVDKKIVNKLSINSGIHIYTLCFNNRIFLIDTDRTLFEYDPDTGKKIKSLEGHLGDKSRVSDFYYSEECNKIIINSGGELIHFIDPDTFHLNTLETNSRIDKLAVISNKNFVATTTAFSSDYIDLLFYDIESGEIEEKVKFKSSKLSFNSLLSLPNKKIVIAGLDGGDIYKIDHNYDISILKTDTINQFYVGDISFDPVDDLLYVESGNTDINVLKVWDMKTLSLDSTVELDQRISQFVLSNKGDTIVTTGGYRDLNSIRVWNKYTGEQEDSFHYHEKSILGFTINEESDLIASYEEGQIVVQNYITGKTILIKEIPNDENTDGVTMSFSADSSLLVYKIGFDIFIMDLKSSKVIKSIHTRTRESGFRGNNHFSISKKDNKIIWLDDNEICISSLDNLQNVKRIVVHESDYISYILLSPDGNECFIRDFWSRNIIRVDLSNGTIIARYPFFRFHSLTFFNNDYAFVSDGNKVYFLQLDTGKYLTLLSIGDEWITFDQSGYFDGSSSAGYLLSITDHELNNYKIDQFAAELNRPDKLLRDFEIGSDSFRELLFEQYNKRTRTDSITSIYQTEQIPLSNITDVNLNGEKVNLLVDFSDSEGLVDYTVFIDNVPIKRESFNDSYPKFYQKEIEIDLNSGNNKIEISCRNVNELESIRDYTNINNPIVKDRKVYYVGLGISDYDNTNMKLQYAAKDAIDLGNALQDEIDFEVKSLVLTDKDITSDSISRIKSFLSESTIDDYLILFIAGHGVHDSDFNYHYILSKNQNFEVLNETIMYKEFEDLLLHSNSRKKLFLIDTCESGVLEKDDIQYSLSSLENTLSRGLGIIADEIDKRQFDSEQLKAKNRYIFNDLARRSGSIVFSSCQGNEVSYESSVLQNGFFTEYLIKSFSDPEADANDDDSLTIHEIKEYVAKNVSMNTNGFQNPGVDRNNIYINFQLPVR